MMGVMKWNWYWAETVTAVRQVPLVPHVATRPLGPLADGAIWKSGALHD